MSLGADPTSGRTLPQRPSLGSEVFLDRTYVERAAKRVQREFDRIDDNDDEVMLDIAHLAYRSDSNVLELFP